MAERIGSPHAARAVGNAVGANPIPIIVPCHRVIAADGLGGYSCGIEIKKRLLQIEGALL
jgi:O-6-methylguanine DNA methyltransferase